MEINFHLNDDSGVFGEELLVGVEVDCWKGFVTLSTEIEQDVQLQSNTVKTSLFVQRP